MKLIASMMKMNGRNNFKKYALNLSFVFSAIFGAVFLFGSTAQAATITNLNQTSKTVSEPTVTNSYIQLLTNSAYPFTLANKTGDLTSQISSVTFHLQKLANPAANFAARIGRYNCSTSVYELGTDTNTTSVSNTEADYTFNFASPYVFDTSKCYFLEVHSTDASSFKIWGSSTDSYIYGYNYSPGNIGTLADYYFLTDYNIADGIVTQTSPTGTVLDASNGQVLFSGTYNNGQQHTYDTIIITATSSLTSELYTIDTSFPAAFNYQHSGVGEAYNAYAPLPFPQGATTTYQMYLWDYANATGTTPTAPVTFFYGIGTYAPPAPPSVTCGGTDFVCQFQQWFSTEFNNLMTYLFAPKGSALSNFTNLFSKIQNKPPIGYFTLIKNQFTNFSTSTPVYSLQTIPAGIKTSFFDPFKTLVGYLLWLIFAVWFIKRISHLELG